MADRTPKPTPGQMVLSAESLANQVRATPATDRLQEKISRAAESIRNDAASQTRHDQTLEVLVAMRDVLEEQQTTSTENDRRNHKLQLWILGVAVAALLVSLLPLIMGLFG